MLVKLVSEQEIIHRIFIQNRTARGLGVKTVGTYLYCFMVSIGLLRVMQYFHRSTSSSTISGL